MFYYKRIINKERPALGAQITKNKIQIPNNFKICLVIASWNLVIAPCACWPKMYGRSKNPQKNRSKHEEEAGKCKPDKKISVAQRRYRLY